MVKRVVVLFALCVVAGPAAAARPVILASQDWWPVWSHDDQWVAFTRVSGAGTMFTLEVAAAGGGRVVAVAQARSQLLPSWSADSTHLVYQAGGHIFTVARDGTGRRLVATGFAPDWASTGAIAYVRDGVLIAGGTSLATGVISKPEWSLDGSEVAFARAEGIYVVQPGGTPRLLAASATEPATPAWSLDGKQIAYSDGSSIFVAPADGSAGPRRVAGPYTTLSPPTWSQEGDALAYTADGRVLVTWTAGTRGTVVGARSGVGAAFSHGDLNGYRIAVSVPLARCPGHTRIDDGVKLTGTCAITGTRGADVIEGTSLGGDVILAGAGSDRIHAADGHADRVDCGPGRDTVWADRTDKLAHCEVVHR